MRPLKILMLTCVNPANPSQGDEWRAFGLLRGLLLYGNVTVHQWGGVQQGSHHYHPLSLPQKIKRSVSGPPFATALYRHHFPNVGGGWDVVAAFQLKTARWGLSIPSSVHLLDLTDSLGYFRRQLTNFSGSPMTRLKLWMVEDEEFRLAQQFDEYWVSAQPDASWLASHGLKPVVVPNGVTEIRRLAPGDQHRLLFVGNLDYPPNREGLGNFLRRVWPQLSDQGYWLDVAGRGSEKITGPRITGHGYVEDLAPLYERCGIFVSPVLAGSGTPTKVLEALAHARPVVAWESGITGLSDGQRKMVLTASSDDDWVVQLEALRDGAYRQQIGLGGPRVVDLWGRAQAARLQILLKALICH